jgi:hypothetical protein
VFLVTAVDEESAVPPSAEDGQVCPLADNLGFAAEEAVEATIEPADPMGVTWRPVDVHDRWTTAIVAVDRAPGPRARSVADETAQGDVTRVTTDDGEMHVLAVDHGRTESVVEDVVVDETTRRIAARLGARRVEVRGDGGVVAVRYRV